MPFGLKPNRLTDCHVISDASTSLEIKASVPEDALPHPRPTLAMCPLHIPLLLLSLSIRLTVQARSKIYPDFS